MPLEPGRLDRIVAVKILPPGNPDLKVRFEREARSISSLDEISVDGVRVVAPEAAPPEIIIDSGSEVPPQGKKGARKKAAETR
jgi:hypothetical protein